MSEKTLQAEMFKPDAIISIDISVPFFQRIQNMLLSISNYHKPEELKVAAEKIKSGNRDLLPWEENLETLIVLINTVEEKARKEGHLTMESLTQLT